MSKSSTATVPKRSAWSKGPPQAASAPIHRSYSPAPSPPPQTPRRPSALEQGVPIKDGVSSPRTPRSYSPAPSPPQTNLRRPSFLGQGVPIKDGDSISGTPRSYSPAPSPPPQTHSQRPGALGQSVPMKDGVSIPRSKVGAAAIKQGLFIVSPLFRWHIDFFFQAQ